jgi:hypothetical protein
VSQYPNYLSTFFKSTQDDWGGSYKIYKYPILLVEITLSHHREKFSITASGNDDYSLTKKYSNETEALADLMTILMMKDVDRAPLASMGFELTF